MMIVFAGSLTHATMAFLVLSAIVWSVFGATFPYVHRSPNNSGANIFVGNLLAFTGAVGASMWPHGYLPVLPLLMCCFISWLVSRDMCDTKLQTCAVYTTSVGAYLIVRTLEQPLAGWLSNELLLSLILQAVFAYGIDWIARCLRFTAKLRAKRPAMR